MKICEIQKKLFDAGQWATIAKMLRDADIDIEGVCNVKWNFDTGSVTYTQEEGIMNIELVEETASSITKEIENLIYSGELSEEAQLKFAIDSDSEFTLLSMYPSDDGKTLWMDIEGGG